MGDQRGGGAPLQGAWAQRAGRAPEPQYAAPLQPPPPAEQPGMHEQRGQVVQAPPAGGGGGDARSRNRDRLNAELLMTRPAHIVRKQGTDGQPIQLEANYFKIVTSTDWCLYKYRVDFKAVNEGIEFDEPNFVKKGLLRAHQQQLGGYIFDGTVLYTSHRLPQPLEVFSERRSDGERIQIVIRFVGDMVKGDEHYLQFFNIIMRKCLEYLNLQLVGRNYFDAASKIEVRAYRLELWPGYETSIRQHERDILLCSEITHKVMRQQTLLDILNDCYNRFGESYQERFSAQVIGATVLTDYNNHTYRVDDVDYSVSPMSTFKRRNDEEITYKDYYQNRYQITIRHCSQPLLLSRNKSRDRRSGLAEMVFLVPELCRSTGLTDEMRNDHQMMRELATHTRVNPNGRIQRLLNFNRRLHSEPRVVNEFREWNLRLDNKLVTIPARIYAPEKIAFGGGRVTDIIDAGSEADWTRDVRNKQMLRSTNLENWIVIVPNRMIRDTDAFLDTIRSSVRNMNFRIASPQKIVINDDRANSYVNSIEEIMGRCDPQLIMCVVPNNRADRYSAIKKKCCIDRPVPTQCILGKNLNGKGAASIATKVAVQINCKTGGAPWTVNFPTKGMMTVGFDVCHDTNTRGRDFGALVASLDSTCTSYFSAVSAHTSGEELSNDLATMLCKAIQKYRKINNSLPTRIIVYRDGVSDGQIPYVFEHEVENLKEKLGAMYGEVSMVPMAYIIVTKRLNTRLFRGGNNPPPGTVVDDVITKPNKFDFFIVSQHIKQGTVSPTGYSVIYDNARLAANHLQRLTYKLTHMYFNWSGTVRVPAPCQLAHKLAFLVSQSIHMPPSEQLDSSLYFL